uniref:F-box domain-containing protein n=1 Tax=Caenorhabditis tropicalis TaxID=1561998 RepID=A0A1I7TCJ4_9PELO
MTKPLNYDCWSSIIDKMDANKRFEISRQCPSLKKLEESLPLYIDYLKFEAGFGPHIMTINRTTYTIGTVRVYPKGKRIPLCHQEENEEGGVAFDFGQFGFADPQEQPRQAPRRAEMSWKALVYEEKRFHGIRRFVDYLRHRRPSEPRMDFDLVYSKDWGDADLFDDIEESRNKLQAYYNVRDKSRVIYKPMSQLKIESPNEKMIVKRSTKRLKDCEGKLFKRLFGNRDSINRYSREFQIKKVTILKDAYEHKDYSDVVRGWMQHERPIGSYCSVNLRDRRIAFETILKLEDYGVRVDERCIHLSMNEDSKVQVIFWPLETEPVWVLKWEVIAV